MNNQQYGILLVAAALLAMANRPVLANVCDQPSPLQEHLGEQYWDVEFTSENANMPLGANLTMANAVTQDSRAVFEVLELFNDRNYDSGVGVRHICKGAPKERRVVAFDSELRPGYYSEKDSGEQRLQFLESAESDKENILFDDRVIVELPTSTQWQAISDNTISTSLVFRRANALRFDDTYFANRGDGFMAAAGVNNYSMLQQIDTTLSNTGKGIQLTQTMYINGHRESWASWLLKK